MLWGHQSPLPPLGTPTGCAGPTPPSCPTSGLLLPSLESSSSSCLWIRTTQMERALERQILLEGEDHPRKPPREVGAVEIQGEPAPRSGMGREGPRLPCPIWPQCSRAVGRHRLAPLPVGSCGCQAQGWDGSAAPGAAVVGAGGERCLGRPPALHQHPKTAASGALWVWKLLL